MVLLEEDVFSLSASWNTLFGDSAPKQSKRLALGFADPPWGVNKDSTKMGGIDLVEERWGRCVILFVTVSELKQSLASGFVFGYNLVILKSLGRACESQRSV